jgi:hypothetical protein
MPDPQGGQPQGPAQGPPPGPPPVERPRELPPPRPPAIRLDAPIDLSLADLLARPRPQLAQLADELAEQVRLQEQARHQGELSYTLLPDMRFPLAVPVFREAQYSAALKVSLPPYCAESDRDNAVALHLARFGDVEGALRLADNASAGTVKRLKACRLGKNYPVEWSRLVGLHLHTTQVQLATGDAEGARKLIALHRQLRKVLDATGQASPLGAVLLARGRTVLARASAAWRKVGWNELADQVDRALAGWGKVPALTLAVPPGSERADVARLLGSQGTGHVVVASPPTRALDLLALPLPATEVEAVLACFDGANWLAEVVVVYRPGLTEDYAYPAQLAQVIEDSHGAGVKESDPGEVRRRTYKLGRLGCDVAIVPNNTSVGALVRFGGKQSSGPPALNRDLGVVDFDRSFEQNRVRFAPRQRGRKLEIAEADGLDRILNPLKALRLTRADLESDADQTVTTRLVLTYAPDRRGLPALSQIALPLWVQGGPMRFLEGSDEGSRSLSVVWEDARTRYRLRLPQGRFKSPTLEISDRTSAHQQAQRSGRVTAAERDARRARLMDKKPVSRIRRVWEGVGLGMSRSAVLDALPQGEGVVRRQLPDGLGVIFKEVREDSPGYTPRELFVRLGPDGRVAEVRVRYTDDPGAKERGGVVRLLAQIRSQCGAPWQLPSNWSGVWSDFPRREPTPVLYRWLDDVTVLTCQRDSEGVELVVRDCPLDHEEGIPLAPFQYLPAGPDHCPLGSTRAGLLKKWKDAGAAERDGVLLLKPQGSPFDLLQVHFNNDDVVDQVTARHRPQWKENPGADRLAAAVQLAWSKQLRLLGWPRREDYSKRKQMQSWTSHDELSRVSIFWQESKSGPPRLYTEWKLLGTPKK